ncbi:hypothetical protein Lal_00013084, partial [Lupinus albus]
MPSVATRLKLGNLYQSPPTPMCVVGHHGLIRVSHLKCAGTQADRYRLDAPASPSQKIKRPKKVLDEDTYTEALSQIIARDFFPGLLQTEIQQEYLDALESKDAAWISSAGRRLQHVMTPGRRNAPLSSQPNSFTSGDRTPSTYGGDTPASVTSHVPDTQPRLGANMSLTKFQDTYTSEDNESFYKLVDKQNQKKADKYAWLWRGNKLPSKQMIKQKEVEDRLSQTRSLIDDGFKKDLLAIKDKDDRPARPDSWNANPRNSLMFRPDGLDDGVLTVSQKAEETSRMAPKSIVYENTRMPQPRITPRPPSPTMSAVRDAIAGKPRKDDRDSSIVSGNETPRVNGSKPFPLAGATRQRSLHERMVERISQSKKESSRNGLTGRVDKTPVPKFPSSPRVNGGLTPAAQRLWSKVGTPGRGSSGSSFGNFKPMTPRGSLLRSVKRPGSISGKNQRQQARQYQSPPFNALLAQVGRPSPMRFVDFAIDLAAVLNASRAKCSKELTDGQKAQNATAASDGVVYEQAAHAARETKPIVETPKQNAPPEVTRTKRAPFNSPIPSFRPSPQQQATSEPAKEDDLDLPPGIDVNVFHTARGSKVLDSLRKQGRPRAPPARPEVGGPVKPHPMRDWPPRPPPLEESYEDETVKPQEPVSKPVEPVEPVEPAEEEPLVEKFVQKEQLGEKPIERKPVEASSVPEPERPLQTPSETPYALRESKVPSSRISRIWNYSGLAAGMLGGAMTEGFSRAFGGGGEGSVLLSEKNMERLVAKLSRMRGAALKLGQMMSFQDTKMLPAPIQQVLQRVQDRADYMPAWQRDRVLVANLGPEWRELFSDFEEKPIAAASIGQVHKATLKNGKRVAVKIQFPGVADSINSDLDNLSILLTATKLLPKGLYLNKTIDNARLELGWECDYERELQCAQRYRELLGSSEKDVFMVPNVYPEASGKQVLTMDFMDGIGVTHRSKLDKLSLQRDVNKLELLDFGASREYPDEFVTQYVQLLAAASRSDKAAVKELSESLGYLTGHESRTMVEAHTKSVLTLAEPFLANAPDVYDFKDQTITERVKALILSCSTSDWHLHQKRHTVCTVSSAVRSSCVPNWVARSLASPCLRMRLPRGDIVVINLHFPRKQFLGYLQFKMADLITLATCSLNQWVLDWEGNLKRIRKSIILAKEAGATLRTGPELEITGYADVYEHSLESLLAILTDTELHGILIDVGLPLMHRGCRYNCRAIVLDGKLLCLRPKIYLANDGENRFFTPWNRPRYVEKFNLPPALQKHQGVRQVPIGDVVLSLNDTTVAAETCEELFTPRHLTLTCM